MGLKVVLSGPPHAGKSCLREGLKRAILSRKLDYPYPYCLPASPDGDGSWYLQTSWANDVEASRYRERSKKPFSDAFRALTVKHVKDCMLPLVLVDIGGKPLPDNLEICLGATHAVILWKEPTQLEVWRKFCAEAKLNVIAEIRSDYHATEDIVAPPDESEILKGSVHHLDRGESAEDRPMVQKLADRILDLTGRKPSAAVSAPPFLVTASAPSGDTLLLSTAFGRPASGPQIVRAARAALEEALAAPAEFRNLLVEGPISVLAASALAWDAVTRFPAIGFYDPKLNHYVMVYVDARTDLVDWKPEVVTTVDFGPVPVRPRRRDGQAAQAAAYFVRAGERHGDATHVEIGVGDESVPVCEMVPAAIEQLAAIPQTTAGVLFDGRVPVIVAAALTCAAMQRFQYVGFLDPRLQRFVVSASRLASRPVGLQI